jgi:23S rRNA (uracil1939-C5)-methyltransferase
MLVQRRFGSKGSPMVVLSQCGSGDVVDVQTFKKRKAYYEGKTVHFHEFSERVNPICEHFGVCGGANGKNMNYSQQLVFQTKRLKPPQHIGKIELRNLDHLGSEKSFLQK